MRRRLPPEGDPPVTPRSEGPSAETTALIRTSKLVKVYRADGITVEAVREVDFER